MKFWITNKEDFEETFVKGSTNYKMIWRNLLNDDFEIDDGILDVGYDEFGSAQFEILNEGLIWIKMEFLGTAK